MLKNKLSNEQSLSSNYDIMKFINNNLRLRIKIYGNKWKFLM